MAMIAIEGFDDGLSSKRSYPMGASIGAISTSYGKDGKGMRVGDTSADAFSLSNPGAADGTVICGFNVRIVDGNAGYAVFNMGASPISASSGVGVGLRYSYANESFSMIDGTGVVDYTTPGSILENVWYFVEIKVKFSATVGTWELRVDGVSVLSRTGTDTIYGSINPTLYLVWGGSSSNDLDAIDIDNVYFFDDSGSFNNDFAGIAKVEMLLPDGNGTSSDMLGSDANKTDNHLLVDNNAAIPPATTEYVGSAVEGEKDTYTMGAVADTPTIVGVQTSIYAAKTETGAKFMRPVIRSGTTDYPGTSEALSDSAYGCIDEAWDVDPDTATTWLYGGVNAMQVGQEVRDS